MIAAPVCQGGIRCPILTQIPKVFIYDNDHALTGTTKYESHEW